jgi:hypothetical protein
MLKRLSTALLLLLTLGVFAPLSSAISAGGIQDMARYFGDDYQFFVAIRTDDGYVDALNGVINRILPNLPASLVGSLPPSLDLRQFVSIPAPGNARILNYDDLRAFVGGAMALGIRDVNKLEGANQAEAGIMFAMQVTDRAALEAALNLSTIPAIDAGPFSVRSLPNDTVLALTDDLLMVANESAGTLPPIFTGLEATAGYQQTVGALPADGYNIVVYVNAKSAIDTARQPVPSEFAEFFPDHVAVGATILDGVTLTLDIAVDAKIPVLATPLNPDFLKSLPGSTQALVHGTDLTGNFEQALELSVQLAPQASGVNARQQAEQVLNALTGLSFDEDLLSWTTGDYAVFTSLDIARVVSILADGGTPDLDALNFEAGFVIEATDPAKAANVVTRLKNLATLSSQNQNAAQQPFTVEDFGRGDTVGFVLIAPLDAQNSIRVAVASNASFLYIGTENALLRVLNGDTMDKDANAANAARWYLPSTYSVAYLSDDGIGTILGAVALFGISGPAIQNVFNGIQAQLVNPEATPVPPTATSVAQFGLVRDVYASILAIFDSSSVTNIATGNINIARAVITLK